MRDDTLPQRLTRGLAWRMGVDLAEAVQDNFLTLQDVSTMVLQCRACGDCEACAAALTRAEGPVAAAPAGCPNGPVLGALAELR
ncbi:DUF6455 family protein [Phaeovulum sp. W22_SRMD_FR3]